MISYEQIRVLQAIVQTGTFRGAAEKLHKSQPALSQMIAKLEEEIGFTLISREGYRPALTEKGRAFYRQAQASLAEMLKLREMADHLAGNQESELHLVITATADLTRYLGLLDRLQKDWPATRIRLSTETMGGPVEALMTGRADLIIASLDGVPAGEVDIQAAGTIRILPTSHRDYGPATHHPPLTKDQMSRYIQVVLTDPSSSDYQQSRDLVEDGQRWNVSDFAAKKQIIQAGLGWGGLPEHLIREELQSGQLVSLNIDSIPPRETRLFLIRRKDQPLGPVAQDLWTALAQAESASRNL